MRTKMKVNWLLLSTLCLSVSLPVSAGDRGAKLYESLQPCIDDQTFAVAHLDLTKFDVDVLVDFAVGQVKKNAVSDVAKHAEADLNNFRKAAGEKLGGLVEAGAKDICVVFSMYDFPGFFVAIPIPPGVDQARLHQHVQKLAKDIGARHSQTYVSRRLIMVGLERTLTRLKTMSTAKSPALEASLQACADKTARIVLFPSSDQRRIFAEMLPNVRHQPGTTQPAMIAQDLQWAALGLDGPPSISLSLTIQSPNAEGADRVLTLVKSLYALAGQHPDVRSLIPELDQILKRLVPQRQGSRLRLDLDSAAADSFVDDIVAPALVRLHATATQLACGTNLSGLGKALLIHSNDYNDELPPDLETLTRTAEVTNKSLICPATGLKESYVYRGAGLTTSAIPSMVIVYEEAGNHGRDGRNVLFLDSHVEWVTEERFQEYIKKDNEYRREKGLPVLPAE
ncbi:MAG: hypothetical protein JSW47_01035 [Phycisphaerales bacterium]|nr:MAG: hypothetical protein JSW47_01035 [Phycisphaerales bacterium]